VESLSTKVERLQWRGNKALELSSQGRSQPEIASILQVGLGTVSRDILSLREQARVNLTTHINDRLPEEYQSCMSGLKQVLKLSWDIADKSEKNNIDNGLTTTMTDDKTRLQALSLINDCYKYIMDLTTNGVVITDAIKFVQTNKEKLSISTKEENNSKESKGLDYDEDRDQPEGKQDGEIEKVKQETTNQVF
jgi:DNA-binding CsgD family transcriptional regulator